MKIVLIGAGGYIGRNMMSKSIDPSIALHLVDAIPGNGFVFQDITRPLDLEVEPPFGIIHLAGISRVSDGEKDPRRALEVNVQGTINVLDFALKHEASWVILSGTVESPGNTYGLSKDLARRVAHHYSTFGLKVGVLNFSSVYGGIAENPGKLIRTLFQKAMGNHTIVLTNPELLLNLVHIDHVVSGVTHFAKHLDISERLYQEFDIRSNHDISLHELARMVVGIVGSRSVLRLEPVATIPPPPIKGRIFTWTDSRASMIPIEDGLSQLYREIQEN